MGSPTRAVELGKKLTRTILWSDGNKIATFELDRIASRYAYLLFIAQKETEAILNRHMESLGVRIERQTELVSLAQSSSEVNSVLRNADGREERFKSRWIVGCDGAHSTVRKELGLAFEGGGVGLSFFLGDLEIDGPDAPTDCLALHLHHGGDLVFMGKLSDKVTRVIIAQHAHQAENANHNPTLEEFQAAIDKAGVRIKIHSADWTTPFHVNDRQSAHYRVHNAFLAGDAAHIHSPAGGQGMNTGIQDAANLAWKLAAVARGADERILDSYEAERGEVGKALLRRTERVLGDCDDFKSDC